MTHTLRWFSCNDRYVIITFKYLRTAANSIYCTESSS